MDQCHSCEPACDVPISLAEVEAEDVVQQERHGVLEQDAFLSCGIHEGTL